MVLLTCGRCHWYRREMTASGKKKKEQLKKGKRGWTNEQDARDGEGEEGIKGKRGGTNNHDAREGRREKGREKAFSWIDDDGSYMSYISTNYE